MSENKRLNNYDELPLAMSVRYTHCPSFTPDILPFKTKPLVCACPASAVSRHMINTNILMLELRDNFLYPNRYPQLQKGSV